jgi:F-type H+-transporting ATPase subunit b
MFKPVKYGLHTLVDGGIVNTFPIDKVHRNGHDILVGFDVNDVDSGNIVSFLSDQESLQKRIHSIGEEAENAITSLLHDPKKSLLDKVKIAGSRGQAILRKTIENERKRVLRQAQSEIADLAIEAASKIIGENVDDEKNRKLVDKFLSDEEGKK